MKAFVVAAQYYLEDRKLARCMDRLQARLGAAGIHSRLCTVDLRAGGRTAPAQSDAAAPYPFLDISAYREGVLQRDDSDVVLVLNDTLFSKHPWPLLLKRLVPLLPLLSSVTAPVAAGAVHPTTDLLLLDSSNPTRRHLSTFMFAANRAGIGCFESLVEPLPQQEDPLGRQWLAGQMALHPALALLLQVHLGQVPSPWAWPGMQRQPSPDLVQRKAITVAVEYLYTQRLLQARGCILPINLGARFRIEALLHRLSHRFLRLLG